MKNNIKISALVVAHNEENKLASCLKNLVYAALRYENIIYKLAIRAIIKPHFPSL